MKKLYQYVLDAAMIAAVLVCSACAGTPAPDPNPEPVEGDQPKNLEEITIPASIFEFANSDIDDNFEEFSEYCYSVERDGNDLILGVTPSQKEDLIEMYSDSIDDVLEKMTEEEQGYYVETDKDHSRFVYHYDEKIDGVLQAKMLLTITTSDVLIGILETKDPNWNVQAKIVNCHTGLAVGETTFPQGSITFGPDEWKASYDNGTFGPDEWKASYDNGAWLKTKQEEVMAMTGLGGTTYEELTDTQKGVVTSVGQMMDWIEGKYGQKFYYISYAPGDALEQEHLKVYPDESDVVTVYRTYENGRYQYEDDYGSILVRPSYEEQILTFAKEYLPLEGIKIYTEVKGGTSNVPKEGSILNTVSAATMANSEDWKQIDRSNYEDKLREDIYTKEAECAISGSGKVTVN